ncbi:MAG: hypothetical protein ABMA64_06065 [Myxococcota bacterium]
MDPIETCDLVIFVATESELDALDAVADDFEIPVVVRDGPLGEYRWLGTVGHTRVLAARTAMGALDFRGSGSRAVHYVAATQATGVLSLGMAFGCDRQNQNLGDVLVGTQLVPYDNRDVRLVAGQITTSYGRVKRRRAKKSLVRLMANHAQRQNAIKAHFGALLSGAARIHCAAFRDQLRDCVPQEGDPIIGGEMEGVGLLAASDPAEPNWLVVKGISDFGDEDRDNAIEGSRGPACLAAARFVLGALAEQP